jgi:hypothetical protein
VLTHCLGQGVPHGGHVVARGLQEAGRKEGRLPACSSGLHGQHLGCCSPNLPARLIAGGAPDRQVQTIHSQLSCLTHDDIQQCVGRRQLASSSAQGVATRHVNQGIAVAGPVCMKPKNDVR